MAPRISFRRPYPTHKDGNPIAKRKNVPAPRPSRFAAASADNSALFASMAVGAKTDPISAPTSTPQPSKFSVASAEYQALFTSMAVGAQSTPDTPIPAPQTPDEERTEYKPVSPGPGFASTEIVMETLVPTPNDTPAPQRPKFTAASQEYQDLFTSMAVGAKKPSILPSTPLCPYTAEIITKFTPALPPVIEVREEFVEENAIPTVKTVPPPPKPKFAVASPEYYDLFTSMAVGPKFVQQKLPTTPRQVISQLQTSPTTSSSSSPPVIASPFTPEETGSSSAGSSPPRPRPQTTDLIARRMIGAALGIKVSPKKDEKTSVIQIALRMKGKGEGLAAWEDYVACAEN